ncbi:hypothetical protein B277_03008 [Janibacter hoylei PVAS-1]|uniref:Uncharacterized protein n=1 Tax=Janibacter hoylei PVAS-1 TaxID=1210046 RepID=K1E5F4_9MICO|nr:hypothetical protein [Janibacter hoylei]EKA62261.1 hypothetical protein B277_03008 [Janibacter hoylei PVAS-1]RWU85745.1 hypothetical protein CWN80_01925 [Janibacter hoylei PVAS-1]
MVAIATAGVAVLAGCGGDGGSTDAVAASTELGSVGTVSELKDAAIAAGYACPSWVQDNVVKLAAESGRCSDSDVFTTYLSESSRDESVQIHKAMAKETREMFADDEDADPALTDEEVLLVGPNWIINSDDAASLQADLGGQVVRY